MNVVPAVHVVAICGIGLAAWLLVRIPRALFTEAGEAAPEAGLEWRLAVVLAVIGVAVFEAAVSLSVPGRIALAACAVVLVAVVYSDLTYLVIPDLYSVALIIPALAAPWRLPVIDALVGAAITGALLFAVAWAWRRFASIDGLGMGDVKLAAALGALLGAQDALLAISLSAALAALLVYGLRLSKGSQVAPLVPYGAALALAGGGFLAAGVL